MLSSVFLASYAGAANSLKSMPKVGTVVCFFKLVLITSLAVTKGRDDTFLAPVFYYLRVSWSRSHATYNFVFHWW